MCINKKESNKWIHPRKMAPKFNHQKLEKQKLTAKKCYGKGCVSIEKEYIAACGEDFYGIGGVLK